MNLRNLLPTLPLLLALGAPPLLAAAGRAPVLASQDDSLPFVYKGDGLTVVITALDDRTSKASGSLYLGAGGPMPLTLEMRVDSNELERGTGKVQTPDGEERITSRENEDGTVRVHFDGKNYELRLVADSEVPRPGSQTEDEGDPKPTPPVSGGAAPALGQVVLVRHTFNDPGVGGMASHTMLVPKGWKVEGGAHWLPQAYFNVLPSHDVKVTSPEGISVHLEPAFSAKDMVPGPFGNPRPPEGAADAGIPVLYMPEGIGGWKRWFAERGIPTTIPGATQIKVHSGVVIPELTGVLQRQFEPLFAQLRQNQALDASLGMRSEGDCAVLAFESTYVHEGKEWEELRIFATSYFLLDAQLTGRQVWWGIDGGMTFRAPRGQLEGQVPLLKAVADSLKMTEPWFVMRAELQAKLQKIARDTAITAMREAQKRSRIIAQTGREINEIITSGHAAREAIRDRTHERVINTIRGTEDYMLPDTNSYVQLPSQYEHVFSNGNDEYLLTNDALYDPNTDSNLGSSSWQAMRVRR